MLQRRRYRVVTSLFWSSKVDNSFRKDRHHGSGTAVFPCLVLGDVRHNLHRRDSILRSTCVALASVQRLNELQHLLTRSRDLFVPSENITNKHLEGTDVVESASDRPIRHRRGVFILAWTELFCLYVLLIYCNKCRGYIGAIMWKVENGLKYHW